MIRRMLYTVLVTIITLTGKAQQPAAYQLYDNKGNTVNYKTMVDNLSNADVAFIGEIHNCPIAHWLELRLLQSLHERWLGDMAVGMEMFERDNQLIIDEYMNGVITSERFEDECRLWPNYPTDYQPIVSYAKENSIPLIATNVPRRYANVVKNRGLQFLSSLSSDAKTYLPPLPIKYVENEAAEAGFAFMRLMGKTKDSNPQYIAQAQAVKDATMAWSISQAQMKQKKMLHINGNIHSDNHAGIIEYLRQYTSNVKIATVRCVRQEDVSKLDSTYISLADFYICVPEDMTMTY